SRSVVSEAIGSMGQKLRIDVAHMVHVWPIARPLNDTCVHGYWFRYIRLQAILPRGFHADHLSVSNPVSELQLLLNACPTVGLKKPGAGEQLLVGQEFRLYHHPGRFLGRKYSGCLACSR